jgi:hypothetical protein
MRVKKKIPALESKIWFAAAFEVEKCAANVKRDSASYGYWDLVGLAEDLKANGRGERTPDYLYRRKKRKLNKSE